MIDDFSRDPDKDLPCCVYQNQTADTVNTIRSLILSGGVKPKMCCGLLDKASGMEDIEHLSRDLKNNISYVCSAKIYDDLFKFVRCEIRDGVSNKEI